MSKWQWWEKATGSDHHRASQLLSGIWPLHAQSRDVWVWRGQADCDYDITPSIHSRIASGQRGKLTDQLVEEATADLVRKARVAQLDQHEGVRLPDLALLALLQHHGAATPLLDVSFDPLVGLYMAIESRDGIDTSRDGVLIAIRRPANVIESFIADEFADVYKGLKNRLQLYKAPPVSERLLRQRGAFLLSPVDNEAHLTTMKLNIPTEHVPWLTNFLEHVGKQGSVKATGDVAVYRVAGRIKPTLKKWLEARTQLTSDEVLPPAWHSPHLDAFCHSHSRGIPYS